MNTQSSNSSLFNSAISGTLWVYFSTYGSKILVFISTIILARLLSQDDFGVAAYALLVLRFIDFLQGLGMRHALIYYHENEERTNTAFWIGILVGLFLLLIGIFIGAPIAGWFFKDPRAAEVTRVLAFSVPISSFSLVHEAKLKKELKFRRQFMPEFSKAIGKGLLSIILALLGWGAWSLIYGQLVGTLFGVIVFWWVIPWRPVLKFTTEHVRPLLSYGSQIIYNQTFSTFLENVDYLLIGRYMDAATLGVYTLAFRIPELIIKQFSSIIGDVTFPVYAKIRDDLRALQTGFLLTFQYVNIITVPIGVGLAMTSKLIVMIFYGEKWVDAIPVMVAISLFAMARAMVFNAGDVYKAMGKPEILSKIKFFQTLVTVPLLVWATAVLRSVIVVAWSQFAVVLIFGIVKIIIVSKILKLSLRAIFERLLPTLVGAGLMVAVILLINVFIGDLFLILQLVIVVVSGGLVYIAVLWWLQRTMVMELVNRLQMVLKRKS